MKFLMDNWMLIAIALSSGVMLMLPALTGGNALGAGGSLVAAQAVNLMNHEKAQVVDISEPAEFAAGHIIHSKNLPFADFESKLESTVKNKTVPLILVCARGVRAARLVATAKKLGYANAQSISGGLKAWKEAGLPLEKA